MSTFDPLANHGARGFPGVPNEPFFFGRGGKRMTPEDIALQRRLAASQLATGADFSPVQHWTQGLARVANGIAGGLQMRGADRAADANAEESNAVLQALMAGGEPTEGGADPVLAALANPYIGEQVRDIAGMEYQRRNPKPPAPTEFERMLAGAGILPGSPEYIDANRRAAMAKSDPQVTVTLPGGGIFVGPQSELATVLQGGAPTGAAGPPAVLPPDFNFDAPTTQNTPAPDLGANGMPTVLTRQQYQAVVNAKGQAATDAWVQRNNVRITD